MIFIVFIKAWDKGSFSTVIWPALLQRYKSTKEQEEYL